MWRSIPYYDVATLVIVDGHMNSEKYIDVLDGHLWVLIAKHFIDISCLFQEENVP